MSKAFWEGFWYGWRKTIPYALVFFLGGVFVYLIHPYELCDRKYDNPNDIMECVWILEHE